MIFMSQSGLTDPGREGDWDLWYLEHLRVMVSVDGVDSAQRFKTSSPGYSPSLAMYSMRSAAVFQDPYYLSIRGLGEFLPLIDRRHYHRNLFAGLDSAPAVAADEILLVWDAAAPRESPGVAFSWLEAVAIDRSTPYRGVAVVTATQARELALAGGIARYVPASAVFHKAPPAAP
ncbi:MAG: hypothetical protein EHM59_12780 [Betaproteobacteria bacterium]|nr:MAG: hypothetical protein EHM59_12780 [Betaproteobacteria bacterium]